MPLDQPLRPGPLTRDGQSEGWGEYGRPVPGAEQALGLSRLSSADLEIVGVAGLYVLVTVWLGDSSSSDPTSAEGVSLLAGWRSLTASSHGAPRRRSSPRDRRSASARTWRRSVARISTAGRIKAPQNPGGRSRLMRDHRPIIFRSSQVLSRQQPTTVARLKSCQYNNLVR